MEELLNDMEGAFLECNYTGQCRFQCQELGA